MTTFDQQAFMALSDCDKWRAYRDATERQRESLSAEAREVLGEMLSDEVPDFSAAILGMSETLERWTPIVVGAENERRAYQAAVAEMKARLVAAEQAVEVVRHAIELGHFGEGGSTHGWATRVLEAYDALASRDAGGTTR